MDDIAASLAPTGTLRASINLGNPVLAGGTPDEPSGITVALAREIGRRLQVEVELLCFDAAKDSVAAIVDGRADLGFLAIDPGRPLSFTAPYVLIEGVYVVGEDSTIATADDVDGFGIRVGVKEGSAYDLHLTRTLQHAAIDRGPEGIDTYVERHLDVGAGIRQPMTEWVAAHPGHRVLEPAFMQIRQAVAVPQDRPDAAVAWLRALVDELLATGFVAQALEDAGQERGLAAVSER
ncbi:transporter substrate-binding domain-containing protein [Nocardioides currus]|uniref:ABC transporter substrate-binding protein n=1 Tax=Nocardioides currus TaxID=2133958 RepID=A0A2R7YST0_9ACTN|nr:transporter substrate-binding domain-containing protein [Nocardioides currus]PUA79314.1 ABC transporter substrate-binding protein [Nocardioides currus]